MYRPAHRSFTVILRLLTTPIFTSYTFLMLDAYAPSQDVPLTTLFSTTLATMYNTLNSPDQWLEFLGEYVNDASPGMDMAALAESLQDHGQQTPIEIYQAFNAWVLIDGHHRLTLAVLLGWDSVRVVFVD